MSPPSSGFEMRQRAAPQQLYTCIGGSDRKPGQVASTEMQRPGW